MEQIDLFSYTMPKYRIDKPVRLIELFAGIGSQAKALERLGVDFEHYKVIEWDKYAMASYNAIHGTNFETSDIQKIHASDLELRERERYCYIMTYSFPCQDLSLAGKQKGMTKGSHTRSGLLWEVERILDECEGELPQILLMENVPQVIGKKNIKDFQLWRSKLEKLGYSNYVELLNAKNYGIPQNRNRCFMVSILGKYHYSFPKKIKLEKRLKDLLEDKVDEKYYLSDKGIAYVLSPKRIESKYTSINPDVTVPLTAKGQNNWTGSFIEDVSNDGLAPTVMENHGTVTGICEGGVMIKNNNSKGYAIAQSGDGIDISSRMQHHRGTVQKGMSQTLDTQCNVGVIDEEI